MLDVERKRVMNPIVTQGIAAFIAIVSVLIGTFASNWLTFKRTAKEKVWDGRRQAYGFILSKLSSVKNMCAEMDEYMREDANRFWQGDSHVKFDAAIYERMTEVRQRIADDYLLLSSEFIECFEKGFSEIDEEEQWEPGARHESFAKDIREMYPRLLAQAKREISV
jgi:hypothetical protein